MDPQKDENRCFEGGLGALGGHLGTKGLSKAVLADLGQARIVQNLAQRGQDGAKLEPSTARWRIYKLYSVLNQWIKVPLSNSKAR